MSDQLNYLVHGGGREEGKENKMGAGMSFCVFSKRRKRLQENCEGQVGFIYSFNLFYSINYLVFIVIFATCLGCHLDLHCDHGLAEM